MSKTSKIIEFLIKISSPIYLTISSILLIYIFFRSEIDLNGLQRNYFFIYYIITFFLIIFSIISFFLNNKIKIYLIIYSISIALLLYAFEGYLEITRKHLNTINDEVVLKKKQLYEKKNKKKYDSRTLLEIYRDLKKENHNIATTIPPTTYFNKEYKIFPLSGISNTKTISCNENGYYSIYESDRYGFNNPDSEWNSEKIEYLLVGDSFTHGDCVNRPNDISSVLRKLSNKNVLNLGYGGNGPLLQYATLREYLNSNVKKVLWIYFEGNDLEDSKYFQNKILINYLEDLKFSQNLKLKQSKIDKLEKKIIQQVYSTKLKEDNLSKNIHNFEIIKFLKLSNTRKALIKKKITSISIRKDLKKILKLTKNLIDQNNSKFYFVYLPEYNRFTTSYDNSNYNSIKKILKELDITLIDITKELSEEKKKNLNLYPFALAGHFSVSGYKKISNIIYRLSKD